MSQHGFTLIEIIVGIAIFTMVIGAVYVGYTNVIDIATTSQFTSAALSIMESRVEMVRNMRFEDVGTVGGAPAGILPQTEAVLVGSVSYDLTITVRYIDDPFDGTVFGSPSFDPSPADYKHVQFDVSCTGGCAGGRVVSMATLVAEKRLENEDRNGNLLITVIDASGNPVPQATLHVENPSASPAIDLTTTTDNQGQLLLLSVATGSAAYEITASKTGYSTDLTYPPDAPANALKPHATVATQQLTQITMVIDRVSTLNITARDPFCADAGLFSVRLTGGKMIGELPDVPKYNESHTVPGTGTFTLTQLEWDAYTIVPTDASLDLVGTTASLTFQLDPATTKSMTWSVASGSLTSALITVTDASGAAVNGADVTLSEGAATLTAYTGQWPVGDTDWSQGQYEDIDAGLDTDDPGVVRLRETGGTYATGSAQSLTSRTFDLGAADAVIERLEWLPVDQPDDTSVKFQLAVNIDGTTWDFVGLDGASTSYFESPGAVDVPALTGRYVRYRMFLETADPAATPSVEDVVIRFSSSCVLSGHAYFEDLVPGTTYDITVSAPLFTTATASLQTVNPWTQLYIPLSP